MLNKSKARDFLIVILFLQFLTYSIVFFDIPVVRQLVIFPYLTFVPGFIIVTLSKLNELDGWETILVSVGISIASLMIVGLLVNELGFLLGISQPLSLMPLLIVFNSLILSGGVLVYLRQDNVKVLGTKDLGLSSVSLLLIVLPALSILGAFWVNIFDNNILLLLMLIAVPLLFVIGVVSRRLLPSKLYPFAILMITISLLYHSSLISNYIVPFGSDVPLEYAIFKNTQTLGYWSPTNPFFGDVGYGRMHSMLSIAVLPTIYSDLLNMDPTWVFKIIFPLIFSLIPLGLYQIWKRHIGEKYAFISAFFFVALQTFYTEMLGLNRQIVAELFFMLLLLVILKKDMRSSNRFLFFMLFSFGLVTSHYGLSEIFLFFILVTFMFPFVFRRQNRNVTLSMVVFFLIMMFAWYIYTSGSAAFNSILDYGDYIFRQLGDFLNPAARGQTVLTGLGLQSPPTVWNAISRAFAYITEFLIIIGFLGLATKRIKVNYEREFSTFAFIATAFLAALILVPGLANTLNMARFYHILLFFLAPLCVVGAVFVVKFTSKREKERLASILLLIVLVPYFLFQTNFLYEVTGSDSWSVPLSGYRMNPMRLYGDFGVIDAYSASGAVWFSENINTGNTHLYSDRVSLYTVLTAYGMIYRGSMTAISNSTVLVTNDVLYLGYLSVSYGKIVGDSYTWNSSDVQPILNNTNIVYSNGGSSIYVAP